MATAPSKAKTGANAVVFTVLVIAAVLVVNLIAARFPKRMDLTADHVYTLSPASKWVAAVDARCPPAENPSTPIFAGSIFHSAAFVRRN